MLDKVLQPLLLSTKHHNQDLCNVAKKVKGGREKCSTSF